MKKQWIIVLLVSFILIGCKKSELEGGNINTDIIEKTGVNPTYEDDLIKDTEQTNEMDELEPLEQAKKNQDVNLSYYANFIYTSYDGDVCFITFGSVAENQINFKISVTNYEPNIPSQVSTAENCIGTLRDNVVEFNFVDNFNNKGVGTLRFDKDDILLKTTVEETNPDANYSLEAESKLFREEFYGDSRTDSTFVFPDSNSRYLNEEELIGLSKEDLGYARNEIFARYGYFFSSPKYASYFHRKTWYDRHAFQIEAGDKPEDYLNDYEIQNIKLIKKIESQ